MMNNQSPRPKPARNAFLVKLQILEEAAVSGTLPSGMPRLESRSDFQNWDGPQDGVRQWSNTKVMNLNGPNSDLRVRLEKIWSEIQRLQGRQPSTSKPQKSVNQRHLESKIAGLNVQVYKLIVERDSVKNKLILAEQQIESLANENKSLVAKINKIAPFSAREY